MPTRFKWKGAHFLQDRKPRGNKVEVLQAQPLPIPATVMKKLKGNVRLALTHGHLQDSNVKT